MDDPLQQLRDLHLPAPPGYWPPAPGWWVLATLAAALAAIVVVRIYRAHRRRRPFRIAERGLDTLLVATRQHELGARAFADAVNALLKRALIHGARRLDAAPLTGAAWLAYLDAIVADDAFSRGAGVALGNDRFAHDFAPDPQALHSAAGSVLRALARESR
jgi:hypothetical protein